MSYEGVVPQFPPIRSPKGKQASQNGSPKWLSRSVVLTKMWSEQKRATEVGAKPASREKVVTKLPELKLAKKKKHRLEVDGKPAPITTSRKVDLKRMYLELGLGSKEHRRAQSQIYTYCRASPSPKSHRKNYLTMVNVSLPIVFETDQHFDSPHTHTFDSVVRRMPPRQSLKTILYPL